MSCLNLGKAFKITEFTHLVINKLVFKYYMYTSLNVFISKKLF